MPADPLQIALEHHRAGRVAQAARTYRSLIDEQPQNAEALHWMGVLAFQAGRPLQAIPFLEQAATLRAQDPAFAHNLAMAYLHSNQPSHAIKAFERAAKLAPDRPDTLMAWGLAHLVRAQSGDAQAAVFAFRQANLNGLDTPQLHQHLGLAHLASGNIDAAIASFLTAAEKDPNDPTTWHHLALAHRHRGDLKEVRKYLNKALEIDPARASAWCALGAIDAEAGNFDIAAGLYKKAIRANPRHAPAHHALGRALESAGRHAESLEAFGNALRAARKNPRPSLASPRDPSETLPDLLQSLEQRITSPKTIELHHALAANTDVFSPVQVPANALANLFDKYADTFDAHLQGTLQYRVPELLAQAIGSIRTDDRALDILDLGCGTGLCGPLLRPIAASLAGVDLSANMIEKCKERRVYDRLGVGELVATLNDNPRAFDLLVAADVLLYIGDLAPTFEAAAKSLRPGGMFAFSVEAGSGERYHLQRKTLRYTHAESYLKHLARIYGFEELLFETVVLRVENQQPVPGHIVILKAPPSPSLQP